VEAYDVLDTTDDNNLVGSWERVTVFSHINPSIVASSAEQDTAITVTEDDPPANTDHVVSDAINYADSSVEFAGQIKRPAMENFLQSEVEGLPWKEVSDGLHLPVLVGGAWSGMWVPGNINDPLDVSYGVISKILFAAVGFVGDFDDSPTLDDGDLSVLVAVQSTSFNWEDEVFNEDIETISYQLPWVKAQRAFTEVDLTAPDPKTWEVMPFDKENAYSVTLIDPSGNLGTLFHTSD
jgi:hypothetical protein